MSAAVAAQEYSEAVGRAVASRAGGPLAQLLSVRGRHVADLRRRGVGAGVGASEQVRPGSRAYQRPAPLAPLC